MTVQTVTHGSPPIGPQGPRHREIPEGDDRERLVCRDCGYIAYENPKMITGAVVLWEGKYLLCRRAIEPRRGLWTIPAGYLEMGENTQAGAVRETYEEATAKVNIRGFIGLYEIPRISQVYVIHYGDLIDGYHHPGPESLETRLFDWPEIPWESLAFPSVRWALRQHRAGRQPMVAHAPPPAG